MAGCMSELPDDIVSHILSLLTVRDAVKTRSLISSWKHLPDLRSVLEFDTLNVFGKKSCKILYGSKFVEAVDQFMQLWGGKKINKLNVKFGLGKEHASHVDRWIEAAISMDVEEIDLDFSVDNRDHDIYIFPSYVVALENAFCLERLSLQNCKLCLSLACEAWLSRLTMLCLCNVPLNESVLECIMSCGSNLTSLTLSSCHLRRSLGIDCQLLCLKKFVLDFSLLHVIKLNCPSLEEFRRCCGPTKKLTFLHVPNLRKVDLWLLYKKVSLLFDELSKHAPRLQDLFLFIKPRYNQCLKTLIYPV